MDTEASLSPPDIRGGGSPGGPSGEGPFGKRASLTGFYSHFFSSFQGAVSHGEASFTREGAACGVRVDGRGPTDLRPRAVACGLLPLSCSSAAIQTEENAVIVTIDSDLMLPGAAGKQDAYALTVGCGAAEEELADVTGGDGSTLSSLLQTMLEQLLLPHLKPLKAEGANNASWRLSIDIIVLKAGGCLLDAVSLAIWAAFKDLRLPDVLVEEGEEKDQGLAAADLKVSCDERISAGRPYPVETVPIFLTAAQIGGTYIWDLTDVEAACADSFLVAVLMPSGACVGLQKFGHTSQRLSKEIFEDMRRQCETSSNSTHKNLDSFFALASV
ncbi:hypothetical protein ACSSS7_007896 [Eimeria intestinalis]